MRHRFCVPRSVRGLLAALLASGWGVAVARNTPDFRSSTDLPALGLRVRLPVGAVDDPLPPLQQQRYQVRQGERAWIEEGYRPRDIWYRSQHVGQWRDARGNLLILGQILHALPDGFEAPHVSREAYDVRLAQVAGDLSDADFPRLLNWARDFLDVALGTPEPLRFQAFRIRAGAFVPTEDPRRMVYLLRINVRRAGERAAQPRSFAVELRLVDGADPERARQRFEDGFLRTLETLSPTVGSGADTRPGGGSGETVTADDDDAMRRSREDARNSVAHLSDWWHNDTPHYILLSNQRRGIGHLIRDLERDLEPMRAAYRALVPPLREIRTVSVLRLFATAEEYVQYVGSNFAWSGGVWDESRGELVVRPVQAARYQEERAGVMRTIYHEAFHQYLTYATKPLRACVWFNEGHATFFEHASIQRGRVVFNEFEPYARIANEMPLSSLFSMDYAQFYAGDDGRRRQHYATAWALIYYLRRAAAAEGNFGFATLLADYMRELDQAEEGPAATRVILARHSLAALEQDFRNFWESPRRRRFAERAPSLPE